MVEGLEDPGERVNSQIEQGASCEFEVDHAVRVWEACGWWLTDAEIGEGAVDGAQLARSDSVADVDR